MSASLQKVRKELVAEITKAVANYALRTGMTFTVAPNDDAVATVTLPLVLPDGHSRQTITVEVKP